MKAFPWIVAGWNCSVTPAEACRAKPGATGHTCAERAARKTWQGNRKTSRRKVIDCQPSREGVGRFTGDDRMTDEGAAGRFAGDGDAADSWEAAERSSHD
jgi:hypothetical protein